MLSLSLNLPKYRLNLNLIRRRKADIEEGSLLPSLAEIRQTRSGHKISRFFRHVFEHKNIRRILGSNLAFVLIASSIIPVSANASSLSSEPREEAVISAPVQSIETQAGIHYPLETVKTNQGFSFFHPGVDFGAGFGDTITPMMAGKVTEAGWDFTGYGNKVVISHGENIETLYAHLSKITVKVGDEVQTSTKIGEVGVTGHSTGPHLHFEIHENGIAVNPFSVLPKLQ